MADNTILNTGTGGDTIATDDIGGGVKVQRIKAGYGADGAYQDVDATHGLPVLPLATEAHLGQVGGTVLLSSATFNRPANVTPYTLGDIVNDSTTAPTYMTFTNVTRIAAGSGVVRIVKLRKSGTSVTNAMFRLHLFSSAPGSLATDNNALAFSGSASWLGAMDVTVEQAFTDGAAGLGGPRVGSELYVKLAAGQTIYGVLEARLGYTPVSGETFAVDLLGLQD